MHELDFSKLDAISQGHREAVLHMNISELGLSTHAYRVLKIAGIKTVGELCKLTRKQAMNIRSMGNKTFGEIERTMAALDVGFAKDASEEVADLLKQRQASYDAEQARRDIAAKKIPRQYQALYVKLKQKVAKNITGTELRGALQEMLVSDPQIMEQALQDTIILAAISDGIEAEEKRLRDAMNSVKRREEQVDLQNRRIRNMQADLEREKQKADAAKEAAEDASKALREALEAMETPEAQDRLRAYYLYVADMKDTIRTPQNNSMFLAGAASMLSGTTIVTNKGD